MRIDRQRPLVVVGDLMQHEAFARGEADPQPPLLPAQLVARQREARPLRLGDLDRLEVRPPASRRGVVVGRLGGDADDAVILDLEHLARVEIDDADEVVDRVRVRVVARVRAHVYQRTHEPAPAVVGAVEAGRPRFDADVLGRQ